MDLIEQYGKLAFNLDFYTDVMDLTYLLDHLAADPFFRKFLKLNEKLAGVIQDYGLVSFVPLNVQGTKPMSTALETWRGGTWHAMMSAAVGADFKFTLTLGVQDGYVGDGEKTVEEVMMDL